MSRAYYNEFDPYAAAWLRNLIAEGLIADGDVDERSIVDVQPGDLEGYTQCHFFAGIGGWSYALRLAGWPDDRPVWTGSCPCQPFSAAGRGLGEQDSRHLWPEFRRLIAECAPPVVFGEQVASRAGRDWLARVRADLEALGYAVGAADLCAAGVGAPHIRQRLWWVADGGRLDFSAGERRAWERHQPAHGEPVQASPWRDAIWLPCADGKARRIEPGLEPLVTGLPTAMDGLGPVSRVGTLKGAGNAIVPEVAAEFIGAFMERSA